MSTETDQSRQPGRVPAGVPTGGQFAASARNESEVALDGPDGLASPHGQAPAHDALLAQHYDPIEEDEFVVAPGGRVRVSLTNIGEGWDGDHDEDDPEDEPLLRMDIQVRSDSPLAGDPVDDGANRKAY